MKGQEALTRIGALALGVVVVLGLLVGLWAVLRSVSDGILAAALLVALLALPIVAYVARRWGLAEARGALEGMKAGSETAVNMSRTATDIRVKAVEQLRSKPEEPRAALVLPLPPASVARVHDEVVDL